MKLNEENGLKLEIQRSEINALIKEGLRIKSDDRGEAMDNILNILPSNRSIGIVYYDDALNKKVKSISIIYCFLKMGNTIANDIEIHKEDWIIEEDES